jgi:hypothetical protein
MAADAVTTSANALGRPNSGALGGNCHSWAEGNKLTSGLASALACTLRYLGPNAITNADEIMARLSQALVQVMKRLPKR